MCKVPTSISPVVIRLPHLHNIETIINGLRLDVKMTATDLGHRMTTFSAGVASCVECKMEIEVYHTHPFTHLPKGLAYHGEAIDKRCPGVSDENPILQRVPSSEAQV